MSPDLKVPAATRRLKAKASALAARGIPSEPTGVTDVRATHGAGDVAREQLQRAVKMATALALLENIDRMACEASTLINDVVGPDHHARRFAGEVARSSAQAVISARQVLRVVSL